MKKHLLFFFCALFFCSQLPAQTFNYDAEVETAFQLEPGVSQDIVNYGFVTNLLATGNGLYWVRTELEMPAGWGSAICDKTACYFETVGERALDLLADEQSNFDVHVYTHGMPGDSAVIQFCVFEVNDTTTSQCKTYTFRSNLSSVSSVEEDNVALKILPNPASNYFTINSEASIGRVEMYNVIGSKIRTFDSRETASFGISDLHPGIYLVRIYNEANNRVLSTLRLKKR